LIISLSLIDNSGRKMDQQQNKTNLQPEQG